MRAHTHVYVCPRACACIVLPMHQVSAEMTIEGGEFLRSIVWGL